MLLLIFLTFDSVISGPESNAPVPESSDPASESKKMQISKNAQKNSFLKLIEIGNDYDCSGSNESKIKLVLIVKPKKRKILVEIMQRMRLVRTY